VVGAAVEPRIAAFQLQLECANLREQLADPRGVRRINRLGALRPAAQLHPIAADQLGGLIDQASGFGNGHVGAGGGQGKYRQGHGGNKTPNGAAHQGSSR